MKTDTINCHELTKISENYLSNFKMKLMLLLFVGFTTASAFAQLTSCLVTGDGVSAPFPTALIEACADGANLHYRATPSVTSTFSWALSLNTSGASIIGSSTDQSIEINLGNAEGVFTLTCTVTSIATSVTNSCAVSVAVYKPTVTGVPATRCGPGDITLGVTGLGFNSVATWYAASSGGSPIFTGPSYTTTVSSTTSFWVSGVVTTPFLALTCESPRVEVVAMVYPTGTANANIDQTICSGSTVTLAGSIGGGASSGTWSTSGSGTFAPNTTTLNAVYTPSIGDVTAGTVTLTLTTNDPTGPCPAVHDDMVVTINSPATVNANVDQTICSGSTVTLAGSIGGGASSGTWSTSGSGTFAPNATTLNAVYTPSIGDVTAGTVTLTLTTNDPTGPCPAVHDDMVVTIQSCAIEGCTLGYWKNHTDRWCSSYSTCDMFSVIFSGAQSTFPNLTLLQALNLGGGGVNNLARQGVAALLNACSNEVDYPAPYLNNPQSVIDAVNAAFQAGGNAPGSLASQLDVLNNSGCPLGGTRATTVSNCESKTSDKVFETFPVPFKDQLTIRYKFDYTSDVKIEIFNEQGLLILSKNDPNGYLDKEITLNLNFNKVQEQLYVIKVTTNRESIIKKVISSK